MSALRAAVAAWWPLAAPPLVWALQGALAWRLASQACPGARGGTLSDATARAGVAVVTVVAIAITLAALLLTRARLHGAAPPAPDADAVADERRLAVLWAGGFVAAAFTAGLVYGVLPALLVGVCRTMR